MEMESYPLIGTKSKEIRDLSLRTYLLLPETVFAHKENIDTLMEELVRFLNLKVIHEDLDATLLSPLSSEIDEVWHAFILQIKKAIKIIAAKKNISLFWKSSSTSRELFYTS